jgi:hypothetical protein
MATREKQEGKKMVIDLWTPENTKMFNVPPLLGG